MEKKLPESLQKLIKKVEEAFPEDPRMVQLFINCFTNTLDTTVKRLEDGTTYIITGDIPAMWLRDSVAQIRPYLMAAGEDKEIADMLVGLVRKQFFYVNLDPYANAFNQEANGNCWEHDETDMLPWIWERKYELDSLCYPIQLAYLVWKNTGRTDHFDETFVKGYAGSWRSGVRNSIMRSGRRIILCVRTVILRIRFPGEGRVLWLSRGRG